jgi:hypothetical protein
MKNGNAVYVEFVVYMPIMSSACLLKIDVGSQLQDLHKIILRHSGANVDVVHPGLDVRSNFREQPTSDNVPQSNCENNKQIFYNIALLKSILLYTDMSGMHNNFLTILSSLLTIFDLKFFFDFVRQTILELSEMDAGTFKNLKNHSLIRKYITKSRTNLELKSSRT